MKSLNYFLVIKRFNSTEMF